MKFSRISVVVVAILFVGFFVPATADDVVPSRADQVLALQAKYIPMFDAENARFMAIKVKVSKDPGTLRAYKKLYADYSNVRTTIESNLRDETSDLAAVSAFADEELGEFDVSLRLLERDAANIKTITCAKGKITKKITALNPKCPKGYKKK